MENLNDLIEIYSHEDTCDDNSPMFLVDNEIRARIVAAYHSV